jgi:peptide/nickel transport system substrate-binding protein
MFEGNVAQLSPRATSRGSHHRAICATLALLLALLASQPAPAQTQRPLRIALTQEPGTLNPVIASLAVESDIDQFIFSGLTRYDEHGNQIPDLAERVPTRENGGISPDGRTITYHLVHKARWHDGVPVTSADVAFTFDALRSPKNNVTVTEPYAEIARVETPDPYTVRIIMARPWAPAIDGFSDRNGGAIVPAHLLKSLRDLNHADYNAAPIGSGPYKFVAWHRGSTIELEADPNYFRGAPKIGHITINFLENDNTMMIALRTHELDLADRLNISTYTNLGNVPGMLPAINTQSFWEHLNFNTARAPLDDRRVRLALCYGFDVHTIFAKVFHGLGALGPTDQNPLTPWYNTKLAYYPFDPARANAILSAAGWKPAADGIREKGGKRLSITLSFPAGNTTRDQTGVLLQQYWQHLGVETVIKTYPASSFFAPAQSGGPLYGGKTDVALFAWVNAVPDPSNINVNAADRIPPHGGNVAFYANAEVTRLEYAAASTTIFAQRKALYDKIQTIELHDLPYYILRWAEITDMRTADLDGVHPAIINSTFWNIAKWHFH